MTGAQQRGASIVLALFLLVTLSALGAFLLTIYSVQQQTTTQDELAQRAYQAARAGIEWGGYQLLRQPSGAFTAACNGGTETQTITFSTASGNLSGFTARVTCISFGTETEGSATVRSYRLTARGCNDPNCAAPTLGPFYVERELQAAMTN